MVADSRSPIKGKYIEKIGHYNPLKDDKARLFVKKDLAEKWLKYGAKPSDTVNNLLVFAGILKKKIVTKYKREKKGKKEIEEKPVKPEKEEEQAPKPEGQALPGAVEEKPLVSPRKKEEVTSSKTSKE